MPRTLKIQEAGNLQGKLGVVLAYRIDSGIAFINFRGYAGNAVLPFREIAKAGWTEVSFGNFLVCDVEQSLNTAIATNVREATPDDFLE